MHFSYLFAQSFQHFDDFMQYRFKNISIKNKLKFFIAFKLFKKQIFQDFVCLFLIYSFFLNQTKRNSSKIFGTHHVYSDIIFSRSCSGQKKKKKKLMK